MNVSGCNLVIILTAYLTLHTCVSNKCMHYNGAKKKNNSPELIKHLQSIMFKIKHNKKAAR